ncbi:MAG: MFS transporter, partial [Dehalococcoidales bacterium]|nr:MFS transporter [Dehalococcoidales bacterium]
GLVMNYWQALANQIAAGFFRALIFSPGMALITGWFPPERRATATGLYLVGGATGNVFFSLVGPWLAAAFDWRFAFISIASLGLVAVFFLAKYGKESPAAVERRKVSMKDVMNLFRYRIMQICGGIQFIRFGVMGGVTYWLPSLLVNEKDFSLPVTGILIAVQSVLMAPSVVIGGYVSDRLKNPILVIGAALMVLSATSALLVVTNNLFFLVVLVAVNAMFLNIYFGPLFTVPVEALGLSRAGITSGFGNFFASLGGFSMVYSLGALKDSTGNFRSGFWAISGMCLFGLILTLILLKVRQRASPEDA